MHFCFISRKFHFGCKAKMLEKTQLHDLRQCNFDCALDFTLKTTMESMNGKNWSEINIFVVNASHLLVYYTSPIQTTFIQPAKLDE